MTALTTEQLTAATIPELESHMKEVDDYVQALRTYQQKVHNFWEVKEVAKRAADKVARMTPGEREALRQVFAPAAIESAEKVNTI